MSAEERIVGGDLDREALRVLDQSADWSCPGLIAALDTSRVLIAQSEEGSVGDVVVHELSPLHHVVGVQLAGGVHVRDDVDADQAGGGKGRAGLGDLGPPHPVTVLGQEGPLEGSGGRPP